MCEIRLPLLARWLLLHADGARRVTGGLAPSPPAERAFIFCTAAATANRLPCECLVGPMDKAPVYGTGDSGFESRAGLAAAI